MTGITCEYAIINVIDIVGLEEEIQELVCNVAEQDSISTIRMSLDSSKLIAKCCTGNLFDLLDSLEIPYTRYTHAEILAELQGEDWYESRT